MCAKAYIAEPVAALVMNELSMTLRPKPELKYLPRCLSRHCTKRLSGNQHSRINPSVYSFPQFFAPPMLCLRDFTNITPPWSITTHDEAPPTIPR